MSRCDVRTGSDGRPFFPLDGSNVDRYRHLSKQRNTKSRTHICTEKREILFSKISVFISLASILCSAALFYLFTTKSVLLADNFCVPCNKIKFSPYPNENEKYKRLEKDYENNVEVCCASTPQTTEDLLYLISERKLRDSEAEERNAQIRDGYFKGSIISGHVLMSGYNADEKPGPVKLLQRRKLSHLNGLNITHNRLIIATKGKYYLYSQVYFKVILDANTEKLENVLNHCIMRYNSKLPNSESEMLLDSQFTVQLQAGGRRDDHDFSSKFISGIFELEAGDQLYVKVTDTTFISRIPEHNFVGLFLLG